MYTWFMCVGMYTYIRMCVCVCVCVYIYIYIYIYIFMYVCMYVHVHACVHAHDDTRTYMIHTRGHMQILLQFPDGYMCEQV